MITMIKVFPQRGSWKQRIREIGCQTKLLVALSIIQSKDERKSHKPQRQLEVNKHVRYATSKEKANMILHVLLWTTNKQSNCQLRKMLLDELEKCSSADYLEFWDSFSKKINNAIASYSLEKLNKLSEAVLQLLFDTNQLSEKESGAVLAEHRNISFQGDLFCAIIGVLHLIGKGSVCDINVERVDRGVKFAMVARDIAVQTLRLCIIIDTVMRSDEDQIFAVPKSISTQMWMLEMLAELITKVQVCTPLALSLHTVAEDIEHNSC